MQEIASAHAEMQCFGENGENVPPSTLEEHNASGGSHHPTATTQGGSYSPHLQQASLPSATDLASRPSDSAQCPRCNSRDTKFSYYNNHNLRQPRYFCKGCQRHWTFGGCVRAHVKPGAGTRKRRRGPEDGRTPAHNLDAILRVLSCSTSREQRVLAAQVLCAGVFVRVVDGPMASVPDNMASDGSGAVMEAQQAAGAFLDTMPMECIISAASEQLPWVHQSLQTLLESTENVPASPTLATAASSNPFREHSMAMHTGGPGPPQGPSGGPAMLQASLQAQLQYVMQSMGYNPYLLAPPEAGPLAGPPLGGAPMAADPLQHAHAAQEAANWMAVAAGLWAGLPDAAAASAMFQGGALSNAAALFATPGNANPSATVLASTGSALGAQI